MTQSCARCCYVRLCMHTYTKKTTDRLQPGYIVCKRNHVPTQVEKKGNGNGVPILKNTVFKSTRKLWSKITQDKIVYIVLLQTMSMSNLQSYFFLQLCYLNILTTGMAPYHYIGTLSRSQGPRDPAHIRQRKVSRCESPRDNLI